MSRRSFDLSTSWDFLPEKGGSSWFTGSRGAETSKPVELPHCWNTHDTFAEGHVYRQGWGSYRRHVDIPDGWPGQDCRYRIRLEGFYGFGDTFLKGRRQAAFDSEYLGLTIPLGTAEQLQEGVDVGLRVCNAYRRSVLPGIRYPDFLLYGGLAGRAWLECIPDLHLDESSVWVRSVSEGAGAKVAVGCRAVNCGGARSEAVLMIALRGRDGHVCSETASRSISIGPGETVSAELALMAGSLTSWDVDAPELYDVQLRLSQDGALHDIVNVRFGHRSLEFRERQGLFLNGRRLPLRGVNRHESMPGFGSALPLALHRADAQLIKDMGMNFVRLSHYPQHPEFLDACDELGILVYAELASWKSVGGGRWLRSAQRQLSRMIYRDRNRPSILMWGLGNEGRSLPVYQRLRDVARRLDPTRDISYAENHLYRARRKRTLGFPDVWGMNYEFDVLDEAVASSRSRNVLVTECSNSPDTRRGDRTLERDQVVNLERDLAVIESRSDIAGFALWCFNDYATMRKKRYRRFSGVVDAWRQPKMSARYLQARYVSRPVLHLYANWGRAGNDDAREVVVISNCSTLRVSVGGDTQEILPSGPMHCFVIPFADSPLRVVGTGPYGACSAELMPYGKAHAVELAVADQAHEGPASTEWRILNVAVVDEAGHLVTQWSGEITIQATGPASLHSFSKNDEVMVDGGVGLLWVRLRNGLEPVTLRAHHPELIAGECCVSPRGSS